MKDMKNIFKGPWAVKAVLNGFKVVSDDGICLALFHTTDHVTSGDAEHFAKSFAARCAEAKPKRSSRAKEKFTR